jgi:type II secretory pathway predicted ATPase ExeA
MYLEHFSLKRPPFEAQPDSRFLFPTVQHQRGLAAITYAACEGGEPVLLRGAAGCGKTLLLRALRRQLPREQYRVVFVPEVACSQVGLLKRVVYHLTHTVVPDTAAAMDVLVQQAAGSDQDGWAMVFMLDDWPIDADRDMLAELRWLLNLDLEGRRLGVLLSGADVQPAEHWPGWLVQRLCATAALGPLTPDELPAYITHRLSVAAAEADATSPPPMPREIFAPAAMDLIAEWSAGVPRLANRVAHLALRVAYLDLAGRVEPDAVRRAIDTLAPACDATPAREARIRAAAGMAGAVP